MTQRMPDRAVCRRPEPVHRQGNNENSDRANDAHDDDHSIRRNALGKRSDQRREHDDQDGIDPGEFADRRVQSHFAIAELWKDVIHLQKNRFQESDEEKEHQQPIKSGLPNKSAKKLRGVVRASPNRLRNSAEKLGALLSALCCFGRVAAPEKINRREEQDLEREAHAKELCMRRWLEPADVQMKIERAN